MLSPYVEVGRGLPALLSSVRAFEVALGLGEEVLALLEVVVSGDALGDPLSAADTLAFDWLVSEDEDFPLLLAEEQALRASIMARAAESGTGR